MNKDFMGSVTSELNPFIFLFWWLWSDSVCWSIINNNEVLVQLDLNSFSKIRNQRTSIKNIESRQGKEITRASVYSCCQWRKVSDISISRDQHRKALSLNKTKTVTGTFMRKVLEEIITLYLISGNLHAFQMWSLASEVIKIMLWSCNRDCVIQGLV